MAIEYHKLVPREPVANVVFRRKLLAQCAGDKAFRRRIKEICRRDILFYVNCFVWQYNPQLVGGEFGPFVTWGFQDALLLKILWCIQERRNLAIEKSREMGASWLCLIAMDWMYKFHPLAKFLLMSRSEESVESADPDSLMWKLDFIRENEPTWIRNGLRKKKRFRGNRDNGSSITGTATTKKAGVGGRATAMFLDEFSKIDEGKEVRRRTASTTDCRIFNSTHHGIANEFYEICQQPEFEKETLHWTQHPEKCKGLYRYDEVKGTIEVLDKAYQYPADFKFVYDPAPLGGPFPGLRSPWYDRKCIEIGDARAVAEELDINPTGAVSQFFDPILIRTLINRCIPPIWTGNLLYEHATAKPLRFVREVLDDLPAGVHAGGPVNLWMYPDAEGQVPRDLYAVGCDPSWGSGATPSCLSIVRCLTSEKVASYQDAHIEPRELAHFAVALCRVFAGNTQGAGFIWEQQGPGITLAKHVLELNYGHIYFRTNERPDTWSPKMTDRPGWVPNPDSKRLLLTNYQNALRGSMVNREEHSLKECLKFKYTQDGKSVEHPHEKRKDDPGNSGVNHGDQVIADALAWKMAVEMGTGVRRAQAKADACPVLSLAWRRKFHEDRERAADLV